MTTVKRHKIKLREVNRHLVCRLCRGYYVDATTISECLHSFCRSCIIKYLELNSFCPICEVQIHKTKPYMNLRLDKALQDVVYKLVPGLYQNEMARRRKFYEHKPDIVPLTTPEQRGVEERLIFSPEDSISLSLEFIDCLDPEPDTVSTHSSENGEDFPLQLGLMKVRRGDSSSRKESTDSNEPGNHPKRFLLCPAVVSIRLLKKFLSQKFDLSSNMEVEIMYKRVPLPEHYTLMDVAYIFTWKRMAPMRLFYQICRIQTEKKQVEIQPEPVQTPTAIPVPIITQDNEPLAKKPKLQLTRLEPVQNNSNERKDLSVKKPVTVEEKPAEVPQKQPEDNKKPTDTQKTIEPVKRTQESPKKLAEVLKKPAEIPQKLLETAKKPTDNIAKPVQSPKKLPVVQNKPTAVTKKPPVESPKKVMESVNNESPKISVENGKKPVESPNKLVENVRKPTAVAKKPEAVKKLDESPKKAVENIKPNEEILKSPVENVKKQIETAKKPLEIQKKLVEIAPKPAEIPRISVANVSKLMEIPKTSMENVNKGTEVQKNSVENLKNVIEVAKKPAEILKASLESAIKKPAKPETVNQENDKNLETDKKTEPESTSNELQPKAQPVKMFTPKPIKNLKVDLQPKSALPNPNQLPVGFVKKCTDKIAEKMVLNPISGRLEVENKEMKSSVQQLKTFRKEKNAAKPSALTITTTPIIDKPTPKGGCSVSIEIKTDGKSEYDFESSSPPKRIMSLQEYTQSELYKSKYLKMNGTMNLQDFRKNVLNGKPDNNEEAKKDKGKEVPMLYRIPDKKLKPKEDQARVYAAKTPELLPKPKVSPGREADVEAEAEILRLLLKRKEAVQKSRKVKRAKLASPPVADVAKECVQAEKKSEPVNQQSMLEILISIAQKQSMEPLLKVPQVAQVSQTPQVPQVPHAPKTTSSVSQNDIDQALQFFQKLSSDLEAKTKAEQPQPPKAVDMLTFQQHYLQQIEFVRMLKRQPAVTNEAKADDKQPSKKDELALKSVERTLSQIKEQVEIQRRMTAAQNNQNLNPLMQYLTNAVLNKFPPNNQKSPLSPEEQQHLYSSQQQMFNAGLTTEMSFNQMFQKYLAQQLQMNQRKPMKRASPLSPQMGTPPPKKPVPSSATSLKPTENNNTEQCSSNAATVANLKPTAFFPSTSPIASAPPPTRSPTSSSPIPVITISTSVSSSPAAST